MSAPNIFCLALLREGDGVAARVLKNLDVDIEQTRQEILKELDPELYRRRRSRHPPKAGRTGSGEERRGQNPGP